MAKVLFGAENPSGKLPITFPTEEGQLPLTYNHHPTGRGNDYYDLSGEPLYPFGFGLSYTSFEYSDLKLSKHQFTKKETLEVSVTITNTGKYAGEEVVQLYLRDKVGSLVLPVKSLKDFKKVFLNVGESKKIKFLINNEKLSFYNAKLVWDSEPGDFDIMIGASSADIRLKDSFELIK